MDLWVLCGQVLTARVWKCCAGEWRGMDVYLPLSLDSMGVILFFNNLEEAQRKFLVVLAMRGRESACG
jgi:hypothetical protein